MSEINEFNTGETTTYNPWDCDDYLCPICQAAIDAYVAKLEEDKVDDERL